MCVITVLLSQGRSPGDILLHGLRRQSPVNTSANISHSKNGDDKVVQRVHVGFS